MLATDFYAGQRVQLTTLGQRQGIVQKRANGLGRVAFIDPDQPLVLRVLPDAYAHSHEYSVNYWEPVDGVKKENR